MFDRAGANPHYRIYLNTGASSAEIDVNIESRDGSEVLYQINRLFVPPNPGILTGLGQGFTALDRVAGDSALDYVRERISGSPMITRADMTLLPIPTQNPQDQLKNAVVELLNQAVADQNGTIYAFGSGFSDPNGKTGIHNIHMNQGNPAGNFANDNGVWQDGALFVNLPANKEWIALFIAFQTESWQTDNNGDPI